MISVPTCIALSVRVRVPKNTRRDSGKLVGGVMPSGMTMAVGTPLASMRAKESACYGQPQCLPIVDGCRRRIPEIMG